MLSEAFLDIIKEQNYDIGGVLYSLIKDDETFKEFFSGNGLSIRFNDFSNSHEASTKLHEWIDKNIDSDFIVGPIELIDYLINEPSDNVLKDIIEQRIPPSEVPKIEVFKMAFEYFRSVFFNEKSIPCVSNMTLKVLADKSYMPIKGREKEIKNLKVQLNKIMKNNVVLLGRQGVGKTALMEEVALREKENVTVYELDVLDLISNGQQALGLIKSIIYMISHLNGNKVLFIDEFHILVKSGIAEPLKNMLSRNIDLKFVVATTNDEFKEYIEKNKALERRFVPIPLTEISGKILNDVLYDWCDKLSSIRNIDYDKNIVPFVVEKMKVERQKTSPDKEKDIIDAAFSQCDIDSIKIVNKDVAGDIMSIRLSIPKEQLLSTMKDKIMSLEDELKKVIKGQDYAIKTIANVMKSCQMVKKKNKPLAVLLFTGPTSTGKTELARQLARIMFGSEKSLLQYNCTDYMEEHTVSALLGSPAGYVGYEEGGKLINDLREKPFSVILFDEFEKAHAKVHDVLLPMFEEGIVTDRGGRVADVTNCIIILTSNLGANIESNKEGSKVNVNTMMNIGFEGESPAKSDEEYEIQQNVADDRTRNYLKSLKSNLRPEFLARINEIVVFNSLTPEVMKDIAKIKLDKVIENYTDFNVTYNNDVIDFIVKKSANNPRKLENAIRRHIESLLTNNYFNGQLNDGDDVELFVAENNKNVKFIGMKVSYDKENIKE